MSTRPHARRVPTRVAPFTPLGMLERLEPRQTLAVDQVFNDAVNGGSWRIQVTGANATAVVTAGTQGLRSLVISGTTASSNVSITPDFSATRLTPILNLNLLRVQGDVNSVTTSAGVIVEREFGQGGFAGIQITGRAKNVTVNELIRGADVEIQSTAANNRTSVIVSRALGVTLGPPLQRGTGPGPLDRVVISSGGFLESVESQGMTGASVNAARIGALRLAGVQFFSDFVIDLDVTTTDSSATYGLKTAEITGNLVGGQWTIASNVQRIRAFEISDDALSDRGPGVPISISVAGRVDELRATQGLLSGAYLAASMGIVRAGTLIAQATFGQAAGRGQVLLQSIDSLRGEQGFANVDVLATGKIKQVIAGTSGLAQTTILMNTMDLFESRGNMSASVVRSVGTIDQIKIDGVMSGQSSIDALQGNINVLQLGGLSNSRVTAGILNPTFALASAAGQFSSQRTIGKITLKPAAGGGPFFNSFINAFNITSVVSTLTPTVANTGTAFGLAAVNFGSASVFVNGPFLGAGQSSVDFFVRDL